MTHDICMTLCSMLCNDRVPTIHRVRQFNLELHSTKKEAEMFPGDFGVPELIFPLQWKYLNENKTLPDLIFSNKTSCPSLSPAYTQLRAAGHVEDFEKIVVTK